MRILFAAAHPYLPQLSGGTQANTDEFATLLLARGHQVGVLSGLMPGTGVGWRERLRLKLSRDRVLVDDRLGYPVYRAWHAWEGAAGAVARFRPDVAVVQSGAILRIAGALRSAGVPLLIYNHNVEFDDHGADIAAFRGEQFIANSQFTADAYRRHYGIESEVLVPLFDRSRYKVESSGREVLFVNPHPHKGVDIALRLARDLPHVPFRFVRGWLLSDEDEADLTSAAAALPNVTLHPRTDRMADHYAAARVLLAPSRWAETWGRVATEAQFSGIPVLGSNVGGLPEAVGPGGVLIAPDAAPEDWRDALARLWDDPVHYAALAAAARAHADRPQIDPTLQVRALESLAERVMRGKSA